MLVFLEVLCVEFDYLFKCVFFDIFVYVFMKVLEIFDMLFEDVATMEEIREAVFRRFVDIA